MGVYIVTRDVTPMECSWLQQTVLAGTAVHEFRGATYGCITWTGVACSLGGPFDHPFFELPRNALTAAGSPFAGARQVEPVGPSPAQAGSLPASPDAIHGITSERQAHIRAMFERRSPQ